MTATFLTQVGEGFCGDGPEAAHLNTVLGARGSAVEGAWATALATPTPGHERFVAVLRPGLAVQPMTLVVPKATTLDPGHQRLTWGAAQAGVAGGVADAVHEGTVPPELVGDLLLIAAIWVSPGATEEARVYTNNRTATLDALRVGAAGGPPLAEVLEARHHPHNPFFAPD